MLNIANIRKAWFIEQLEILKEKGISYTEIAASLDIKPQYLNLIKNTERGASEKLTIKLCETFNINHNDLLEYIRNHKKRTQTIYEENNKEKLSEHEIPLYNNILDNDKRDKKTFDDPPRKNNNKWIDTGELFPEATSVIRHYGDSMPEYPSGSILILKRVLDLSLIVWGRNYHIETDEIAVTKRLQDGGEENIIGYSSSLMTYPDGRLIHEPLKIPKKDIRYIHLILGCITKEFEEGIIPTIKKLLK